MSEPQEIVDGVLAILMERHAADIERIAVAQFLGKATRIWWDEEGETFRFEVID